MIQALKADGWKFVFVNGQPIGEVCRETFVQARKGIEARRVLVLPLHSFSDDSRDDQEKRTKFGQELADLLNEPLSATAPASSLPDPD